eukprot:CAMPEP_0113253968 /NCGR_PEP_ID=MMETSP0008_2-20120614/13456_1 /TAXON_ID=97485 /ORGANISM="Prymnesium parvum" /LENGTH=159 /DNA_ID=CAMNT_0000102165 /DNA_START=445 /DNA_END=921 /DNA_ORIENTATION=- /assembly_acc=CAM_ASM_000153
MPSRRCVLCEFLGAAAGVGGITPLGDQKFDESRMDAQASFLMPRPPVLVGFFAGTRPGEFSPGITKPATGVGGLKSESAGQSHPDRGATSREGWQKGSDDPSTYASRALATAPRGNGEAAFTFAAAGASRSAEASMARRVVGPSADMEGLVAVRVGTCV